MKHIIQILVFLFLITSCTEKKSINTKVPVSREKIKNTRQVFHNVSEITNKDSHSTWVKLHDSTASLALHFMYKDTLAVSYSPECWFLFPYKVKNNIIVVYWDENIDTKYDDFDIVQAVININDKFIGKPFMLLEISNDSTLKASYPIKTLVKSINNANTEREYFPSEYILAQDGFL